MVANKILDDSMKLTVSHGSQLVITHLQGALAIFSESMLPAPSINRIDRLSIGHASVTINRSSQKSCLQSSIRMIITKHITEI